MGQSDSPSAFSPAFFRVGWAYPRSGRFSLRPASVSGFPLAWLTIRMACRPSGSRRGLPSSWRFSCHMPGAPTPADPRKSHRARTLDRCLCSLLSAWFPGGATVSRSSSRLDDSSVLASVSLTTSPSAFKLLTRLKSLQGGAAPLWPMAFSVYASPLLFTPTAAEAASHVPPEAQHSIRVGG